MCSSDLRDHDVAVRAGQRHLEALGPCGGRLQGAHPTGRQVGDVLALARGSWAFLDLDAEPHGAQLRAFHGSLTPAELEIPLLLARGRALR